MTSEQDTQIDNQEVPDRCKECGSMFLYRRLAMDWFIIGEPAHLKNDPTQFVRHCVKV